MDIPDPLEKILVPSGSKKVTEAPIPSSPSTSLFTFTAEDHTLGNLLRSKLLKSKHVLFAAYKVPHPEIATVELRVQTDGETTPREEVVRASRELVSELGVLSKVFAGAWELRKAADAEGDVAGK